MSNDAAKHFQRLRGVYRSTFWGADGSVHPAGVEVLRNLRAQSQYGQSPFSSDALRMAYNVGMQDVFRHVTMMLNISDAEIQRLTQAATVTQGEDNDDLSYFS